MLVYLFLDGIKRNLAYTDVTGAMMTNEILHTHTHTHTHTHRVCHIVTVALKPVSLLFFPNFSYNHKQTFFYLWAEAVTVK